LWRRRNFVEVRQPLGLISQIHRSGGTLLRQLPDCAPLEDVIVDLSRVGVQVSVRYVPDSGSTPASIA
jgi:Tfp pilus assembly protein PilO